MKRVDLMSFLTKEGDYAVRRLEDRTVAGKVGHQFQVKYVLDNTHPGLDFIAFENGVIFYWLSGFVFDQADLGAYEQVNQVLNDEEMMAVTRIMALTIDMPPEN